MNCFQAKPTKHLLVLKKSVFGVATFWTLSIAFLCLAKFNDLPSFGVSGMDKYVHFTFHFVFTLLWSVYFSLAFKKIEGKLLLKILLASLLYGIALEFLQNEFTATRKADVYDVMANFTGASIAVIIMIAFKRFSESKQLKNK